MEQRSSKCLQKLKCSKTLASGKDDATKYFEGDYDSLCHKNFCSGMDQFYDYIIKELSSVMSRKDVFRSLIQKGYKGGQTAAYDYMNKIIERFHIDIAVYRSSSTDAIQKKKKIQKNDHISRNGIFRFLWMNHEITNAFLQVASSNASEYFSASFRSPIQLR